MELIFVVAAILGTLYATITDIKNHWVPDFINFSMIFFGIGGHAILSLLTANIWPLIASVAAALIFYAIALAMYHSGSWGGGDAKLLIGLGALIPVFPMQLATNFTKIAPWPFMLTLWFNILLVGTVYTSILITTKIITHWEDFKKNSRNQLIKHKNLTLAVTSSILLPATLTIFKKEMIIISALWALAIFAFYLTLTTKALEKTCMYRKIEPKKLVEGDWVQDTIKLKNKTIFKPKRTGIEKKEIIELIKLKKQGIIDKVNVKEGFPYIPAFLIALIISLTLGDLINWIFILLI
jgi:Flp pilus assembly protein protease CpaA